MKLSASIVVAAPRQRVFAALLDPEVLRRAIPGCESLTRTGEQTFAAKMSVGVAGVKGTYTGTAAVRDEQPHEALTLAFDGKGAPGFVRGQAAVRLADEGGATRITYDADVQVGGLVAAVGSRLIEAAARKITDDFFRQLAVEVVSGAGAAGL
jgi:carbon monoxide dehydrogenase subunit G